MNINNISYFSSRLGYLIVMSSEELKVNLKSQECGNYAGVDRPSDFWPSMPAEDEVRSALGWPKIHEAELRDAFIEYSALQSGKTVFLSSLSTTRRLTRIFRKFSYSLDILYCELAWKTGEECRLLDYHSVVDLPDSVVHFLGFDVSRRGCNHSAIFQPGVVPGNDVWQSKVNANGLLHSYEDATALREEYLQVYQHPPFDIFRVYQVE